MINLDAWKLVLPSPESQSSKNIIIVPSLVTLASIISITESFKISSGLDFFRTSLVTYHDIASASSIRSLMCYLADLGESAL